MPSSNDKTSGNGDAQASSDAESDKCTIMKTKCTDWSLNTEPDSGEKRFWWNKTYSISIWETSVELWTAHPDSPRAERITDISKATDDAVWRGFILYQTIAVYKICAICKAPEQNVDFRICCYCAGSVHGPIADAEKEKGAPDATCCGITANPENIAWKPANKGFEHFMCICNDCEDLKDQPKPTYSPDVPDNARRAIIRTLSSSREYPVPIRRAIERLRDEVDEVYGCGGRQSHAVTADLNSAYLEKIRTLAASYFQPGRSIARVIKRPIESKCGGIGVVAAELIPRFTIIGIYPGYEDPLSGEQAKLGRPGPRYSLVDLNCADYNNNVFCELAKCITPFINEPNPMETSNVAWIQETTLPEGRLSVMSSRDIQSGEELLIGYGPLYPRTYPYNYDAYAYHLVEEHKDPSCFALWHWTSVDEKDANFVCYCGFDEDSGTYSYWETEEEASKGKGKGQVITAEGGVGVEGVEVEKSDDAAAVPSPPVAVVAAS